MAATIHKNPSLQGEYGENLDLAWYRGRIRAINALVDAVAETQGESRRKAARREWRSRIPEKCPWRLEEIVAYDPRPPKDSATRRTRRRYGPQPDPEVFPPSVARRLSEALRDSPGPPRHRPPRSHPGRIRRTPARNR